MNAKTNNAWDLLARPPQTALKQIKGGRLSGMTDINPQWRYKAMHDVYGPCGIGWKYSIYRTWTEQGAAGQVFMFAQVSVAIKSGDEWSDSIPGIGGSMLLESQKGSLHHNDEAVKMAVTDALSVALKMLGVGADIYMGRWDGSKYKDSPQTKAEAFASQATNVQPTAGAGESLAAEERRAIERDAEGIQVHFDAGMDIHQIIEAMEEMNLDTDHKIYFWSLLDSKLRSAIKKAKSQPTAAELTAQA